MIGIDIEAEAAFQAAREKAELDRQERESTYKVDHTRPEEWKAYRTKAELSDDLRKETINKI